MHELCCVSAVYVLFSRACWNLSKGRRGLFSEPHAASIWADKPQRWVHKKTFGEEQGAAVREDEGKRQSPSYRGWEDSLAPCISFCFNTLRRVECWRIDRSLTAGTHGRHSTSTAPPFWVPMCYVCAMCVCFFFFLLYTSSLKMSIYKMQQRVPQLVHPFFPLKS